MPIGRDREEKKWFRGWYEVVIQPAVESCGYEPILSVAEEQPGAINDEIRAHLAFDPMVVVDLGGMRPEDPPTPNVMYELGIRHAFGLPLVIMAWEGQALPFDVGNQRAIMSQRGFSDISGVVATLKSFIKAAEAGRFYNPMEAVGREAALDATSVLLGEDAALSALIKEVRGLRRTVSSNSTGSRKQKTFTERYYRPKKNTMKQAINRSLAKRGDIWSAAEAKGMVDTVRWGKFLSFPIDSELDTESRLWEVDDWIRFLEDMQPQIDAALTAKPMSLPSEFIDKVDQALPPQPWSTDEHSRVAEKLRVPDKLVSRAIAELIDSGKRKHQYQGQTYDSLEEKIAAQKEYVETSQYVQKANNYED